MTTAATTDCNQNTHQHLRLFQNVIFFKTECKILNFKFTLKKQDEEAPAEVAVPGAQTNQATSTTDLKKLETEEEEPHNCLQKCFEHPYTVVGVLFCVIGLENLIRWFIDPNGPTRMLTKNSEIYLKFVFSIFFNLRVFAFQNSTFVLTFFAFQNSTFMFFA